MQYITVKTRRLVNTGIYLLGKRPKKNVFVSDIYKKHEINDESKRTVCKF